MFARRSACLVVLVTCLLLLVPTFPAFALVERYDLERLAAESVNIVWGQVLNVAPHWNAEHNHISSTVTIAVKHYLKGAGATNVQFEIPGGEVDGILQETEDVPEFAVGQETIVFLCDRAQPVTGWNQGKFTVVDRRVVEADWMPVADFVLQVRDVLTKQGHAAPEITFEEAALDEAAPMAVPTITSVSPTSASAGTNTQVTITGTNFGATQGTSTVKFWWGGSTTWTNVSTYDSWSNTQIKVRVPTPASSHTTQAIKVTTSGGSAYIGFTVTFAYRGAKWPNVPSWAKYYVYSNTSDCSGEATALRNAAWTWNNVDYHSHSLKYYGGTTRSAPTNDGYNVLRWGSTGGSIATCTTWSSGSTIIEFDVVFEDSYTWSTDSTCPAGEMDVWNIGIHEIGHGGVGLKDLYGSPDSEKTMYGYGATGETKKRTLHSNDQSAIIWIY